jgi:hypothetical protein
MTDLLLHLYSGAAIAAVIMLVFGRAINGKRQDWVIAVSCLLPLLVGGAKEAGDLWFNWGQPEVADITFTWAGGIITAIFIGLTDWLKR